MNQTAQKISDNYRRVVERVAESAMRANRDPREVTIVGVTKYVEPELARALFQAGCHHLGESRPQVLLEKQEALSDLPIHWHMIGHLQRNKVKRVIPNLDLVHSLDSFRLAEAIDKAAYDQGLSIPVLLEVNISGDDAKHGFKPDELIEQAKLLQQLQHLHIKGLMGMAGLSVDETGIRSQFLTLRRLRDSLASDHGMKSDLHDLSMGMSGDFELAISEGATLVRIGSMLFEGVL